MNRFISRLFFAILFLVSAGLGPKAVFAAATPFPECTTQPTEEFAASTQTETLGSLLELIKHNPEWLEQCIKIMELRANVFFKCISNSCSRNNISVATQEVPAEYIPFHPLFPQLQTQLRYANKANREALLLAEEQFDRSAEVVQKFINLLEEHATHENQKTYPREAQTHLITFSNLLCAIGLDLTQASDYNISEELKKFNLLNLVNEHDKIFSSRYTQCMQNFYSHLKQIQSPDRQTLLLCEELGVENTLKIIKLLEMAHIRNIVDATLSKIFAIESHCTAEDEAYMAQASRTIQTCNKTGILDTETKQKAQDAMLRADNAKYSSNVSPQQQRLRDKLLTKNKEALSNFLLCVDKYLFTLDNIINQIMDTTSGWSDGIVNQILFMVNTDKDFPFGSTILTHYLYQLSKKMGSEKREVQFLMEHLNVFEVYFKRAQDSLQKKGCKHFELCFKDDHLLRKICRETPAKTECSCLKAKQVQTDSRSIDDLLRDLGEPNGKSKKKKASPPARPKSQQQRRKTPTPPSPASSQKKRSKSQPDLEHETSPKIMQHASPSPVRLELECEAEFTPVMNRRIIKPTPLRTTPAPSFQSFILEPSALLYAGTGCASHDETCMPDMGLPEKNCILDLSRGTLFGHHAQLFVYPGKKTTPNFLLNLDYSHLPKIHNLRDNFHSFSKLVEQHFGGCGNQEITKLYNDPDGYKYKITIKIPGRITSMFYSSDRALMDGPTGEFEFIILKQDLDANSPATCVHRFFRPYQTTSLAFA